MELIELPYYNSIAEFGDFLLMITPNSEEKNTAIRLCNRTDINKCEDYVIDDYLNGQLRHNDFIALMGYKRNYYINLNDLSLTRQETDFSPTYFWNKDHVLGVCSKYFAMCLQIKGEKIYTQFPPEQNSAHAKAFKNIVAQYDPEIPEIKFYDIFKLQLTKTIKLRLIHNGFYFSDKYLILWRIKGHSIRNSEASSLIIVDCEKQEIIHSSNTDCGKIAFHDTEDKFTIKSRQDLSLFDINANKIVKKSQIDNTSSSKEFKFIKRYSKFGLFYTYINIDTKDGRIGRIDPETLKLDWEINLNDKMKPGLRLYGWVPLSEHSHILINGHDKNRGTYMLIV